MVKSKDLAERLRIRKTLTVACLKERLSACRKAKEQQLLEKRNQQEQEAKQ
jgi:hypothetical protein